ncbi:hypothetical protein [Umezawaea sp. Da 62-37]|uniref:hypothetical protein n=1 Tax=Umezawaea sp. Da 62-37 TaxID=3075927 RepID=UPI0028F73EC7|nr:hypothetical protein [Umezawaea sp. Da 62-37]WNV83150.1 hypothetical protein RM788_33870 [Umezawaea sp. Da 62-37]
MVESTKPGRRARRSTKVSRRLEEARRRNAEQLAAQRDQERRVEDSLAVFFDAGDQLLAEEQECQRRIEPHERAIAKLREQFALVVAERETAQARAALAIHEADRTVEQVGELLGLGEKAARRLIAAGRDAAAQEATAGQADDDVKPSASATNPGAGVHRQEPGSDNDSAVTGQTTANGTAAGLTERPAWAVGDQDASAVDA